MEKTVSRESALQQWMRIAPGILSGQENWTDAQLLGHKCLEEINIALQKGNIEHIQSLEAPCIWLLGEDGMTRIRKLRYNHHHNHDHHNHELRYLDINALEIVCMISVLSCEAQRRGTNSHPYHVSYLNGPQRIELMRTSTLEAGRQLPVEWLTTHLSTLLACDGPFNLDLNQYATTHRIPFSHRLPLDLSSQERTLASRRSQWRTHLDHLMKVLGRRQDERLMVKAGQLAAHHGYSPKAWGQVLCNHSRGFRSPELIPEIWRQTPSGKQRIEPSLLKSLKEGSHPALREWAQAEQGMACHAPQNLNQARNIRARLASQRSKMELHLRLSNINCHALDITELLEFTSECISLEINDRLSRNPRHPQRINPHSQVDLDMRQPGHPIYQLHQRLLMPSQRERHHERWLNSNQSFPVPDISRRIKETGDLKEKLNSRKKEELFVLGNCLENNIPAGEFQPREELLLYQLMQLKLEWNRLDTHRRYEADWERRLIARAWHHSANLPRNEALLRACEEERSLSKERER